MAKKRIVSVGYPVPDEDVEYVEITSDASLLDSDIVLFSPQLPFDPNCNSYQGRPCYSDHGSHALKAATSHWQGQLREAVSWGKTVIVILDSLEEVYVATGETRFSGTGRNARETRIVTSIDNYKMIPFDLGRIVNAKGKAIALDRNSNLFAALYHDLRDYMEYRVYVEQPRFEVLMHTRAAKKAVGGCISEAGALILLPFINYGAEEFAAGDPPDEIEWSAEDKTFAKRFVAGVIALDGALKSTRALTAVPSWCQTTQYRVTIERECEARVEVLTQQIEELDRAIVIERKNVESCNVLRRLLYEKGSALEEVVREALSLFGFRVSYVHDAENEFDAIFFDEEGRFIGECEGKDDKAINIDKLSQLERKINEDFARDEVTEHAKGVLFGNAYRLTDPADRNDYFTPKVCAGARRAGIALVRVSDMFEAARYLKQNSDNEFARARRQAIASASGQIVMFPVPPRG